MFSRIFRLISIVLQDLSAIGPRRYESKTVPAKGVGKMKRKAVDSTPVPNASKRTRGYVRREKRGSVLGRGYVRREKRGSVLGRGYVRREKRGSVLGRGYVRREKRGSVLGRGYVRREKRGSVLGRGCLKGLGPYVHLYLFREREVSSRGLSHGYPVEHPYNKVSTCLW